MSANWWSFTPTVPHSKNSNKPRLKYQIQELDTQLPSLTTLITTVRNPIPINLSFFPLSLFLVPSRSERQKRGTYFPKEVVENEQARWKRESGGPQTPFFSHVRENERPVRITRPGRWLSASPWSPSSTSSSPVSSVAATLWVSGM